MSTSGRLTKVYEDAERICYHRGERFVMMSDCHRGIGNSGDNFLKNRTIYLTALQYYYRQNYTYVELGDGDELWENKDIEEIVTVHGDVFELLERFRREGRLYLLYGNHDMQKKKKAFRGISAREGMILFEKDTGHSIFLVHGHQGDLFNDTLWRVNRFLVRHIWRKLEFIGIENPMSTSGKGKRRTKVEKKLTEWADNNHQVMIAGHTHRLSFPDSAGCYYINDGSCVRPYSVTAVELEDGILRSVEWSVMTRQDHGMYIGRKVLSEMPLLAFYK